MIGLQEAMVIAKDYYSAKGEEVIKKVYEADDMWIVYAGKVGQVRIGSVALTIKKIDGEVGNFILPSEENFKILKEARLLDLEEIPLG